MIARQGRAALLMAAIVLVPALGVVSARAAETGVADAAVRLTDEQQQEALGFVQEHHPQLNTLITRLKKRDPAEYHKAVREVFATAVRLQRLQARDPQRYDVDLALWKVESRIRLLAARMAADQSASLEGQLRDLLVRRSDLRLQQMTLERERLAERAERLDAQISQFAANRDAAIDKEVDRLRRNVRARSLRDSRKADETPDNRRPGGDAPPAAPGKGADAQEPSAPAPTTAPDSRPSR